MKNITMAHVFARHVKKQFFKWRNYLLAFFLITLVFEVLKTFSGFDFVVLLKKHMTWAVGTFIVSLLGVGWKTYGVGNTELEALEEEERKKRKRRRKKAEKNMLETAAIFSRAMYRGVKNCGLACVYLLLIFYVLAPACIAHWQPVGRCIDYAGKVIEQMRFDPEKAPPEMGGPVEGPAESLTEVPVEISAEEVEKLEPPFLEDADRYCALSEEERDLLYFQSGPYAVSDYDDSSALAAAVWEKIQVLRAEKAQNIFDDNAPEDVKTSVANMKTDYAQMTSSRELDDTINTRMTAFEEYPKYGLAWGLTNDFQEYGDRYYEAGGYFETVEYYYGQSISWAWTTLTFESANSYQVRDILHYISMRYHDIADAAPDRSWVQQQATALYQAFKSIENELIE